MKLIKFYIKILILIRNNFRKKIILFSGLWLILSASRWEQEMWNDQRRNTINIQIKTWPPRRAQGLTLNSAQSWPSWAYYLCCSVLALGSGSLSSALSRYSSVSVCQFYILGSRSRWASHFFPDISASGLMRRFWAWHLPVVRLFLCPSLHSRLGT